MNQDQTEKPSVYLSTILFLCTVTCGLAQDEPFARFPSLSPDGGTIAFSYQGDIWTVPVGGGSATRLTIHEGYEGTSAWSPDGRYIAFESDRFGNNDLFVMQSNGGLPKRLTYHSAADNLSAWTADGSLLFTTRRTFAQVEREPEIYSVPVSGGTPGRSFDFLGNSPAISPDGRLVAFVRGSNGEFRKGYRGPGNRQIWIFDRQSGRLNEITDFRGNDMRPAWARNRTLYYLSEADGTANLYSLELNDTGSPTGKPVRLTKFSTDGVRTFSVARNGNVVAMERQTRLYVMKQRQEPKLLDIEVSGDYRFDPVERKTFKSGASEYAVSPDGRLVAFTVRGEIFVKQNDPKNERTVRLTSHPYRERDPVWLDRERLIFVSDRENQYDLYLLVSDDPDEKDLFKSLKHRATRLTETPEDERQPVVAPDGKKMAFVRGRGQLVVSEITEGRLENSTILFDGWASPSGVAWSPDSHWLAYSLTDLDFNSEIFIHSADNSIPPVNFTQHPRPDTSPFWSGDGSKLGFLSQRNNGDADVWFVWLKKEDWERTKQDWEESPAQEPEPGSGKEKKGQGGSEEGEESKIPPLDIDFDRIHERLQQVTSLPGNESDLVISLDGRTFYFVTNRSGRQSFQADQDLHSVKWDGTEQKTLTTGGKAPGNVSLGRDGKYLFMTGRSGTLARFDLKAGKQETLPFSARMDIRHPEEQEQIFDEAWRTLNDGFYDPDFHGARWDLLREKYEDWARRASTRRDFRDAFNMMLGELNASHLGMSGPDRSETQQEQTGLLGLEIVPLDEGVRVVRVVPESPAGRTTSRIDAGDIILSVEGQEISRDVNFYSLLVDRADQMTILQVQNPRGEEREVRIRPVRSLREQLYKEWVGDRKSLTDRYSGGRLGYIHIQGMNWPSFERFERELVASGNGKEGIVIDVRYNGGGWTTDYLLAVLSFRQHAYTVPRGATGSLSQHEAFRRNYPYGERLPLAAWNRPSIALCNQDSFSNAEIFSHAYKNLDLGTLVGTATFGAVISTGGNRLIDGSLVRMPSRGWFVRATGMNMENGPAVPDLIVSELPDSRARGEDEQLQAAVETLLRQIDSGARSTVR